jgi:hypothetical protein
MSRPDPLNLFGGNGEEVTPVPIPNTEVKLFNADGTAWETAWESRTSPELIYKPLDSLITDQGAFYLSCPPPVGGRSMRTCITLD